MQNKKSGTIIGIDLGTTKSVVGARLNGKSTIFPDRNGHLSIPS
jgi:molecular chaperone DnaK (HSP70)